VRLSNKVVSLDLAPFSDKVSNHWCKTLSIEEPRIDDESPTLMLNRVYISLRKHPQVLFKMEWLKQDSFKQSVWNNPFFNKKLSKNLFMQLWNYSTCLKIAILIDVWDNLRHYTSTAMLNAFSSKCVKVVNTIQLITTNSQPTRLGGDAGNTIPSPTTPGYFTTVSSDVNL